jgi:hypothetical protein
VASLVRNITVGRPDSAAATAVRKATVTFSGSSRPVARVIAALASMVALLVGSDRRIVGVAVPRSQFKI